MAIKHRIRKNGKGDTKIVSLTARQAIREQCRECLGFEINPKDCESKLCSLWPFRSWDTPKSTV